MRQFLISILLSAIIFLAPYLRYFDTDAMNSVIKGYRDSAKDGNLRPGSVKARLMRVRKAYEVLETMKDSDPLFYNDIRPWVLKLKAMASKAVSLLEGNAPSEIDFENEADFQLLVLNGMGKGTSLSNVTAEPAGQVLMPFIEWLKEQNGR